MKIKRIKMRKKIAAIVSSYEVCISVICILFVSVDFFSSSNDVSEGEIDSVLIVAVRWFRFNGLHSNRGTH